MAAAMTMAAPFPAPHNLPKSHLRMHTEQASSSSLGTSLVFDLEVADAAPRGISSRRPASVLQDQKERIRHFCKPSGAFPTRVLRDVSALKRALVREAPDGSLDMVELASRLAAMGLDVAVRTALGPAPSGRGPATACFRTLRHEFLTVRAGPGDFEGIEYIVEPQLSQQFEIPNPTPDYKLLLEDLPQVFVGPASQMIPVVQTLCAEMAASFSARGMTLPPWRRTDSMLTKWLPPRMRDTNFSGHSDQGCSPLPHAAGSSPPPALLPGATAAAAGGLPAFTIMVPAAAPVPEPQIPAAMVVALAAALDGSSPPTQQWQQQQLQLQQHVQQQAAMWLGGESPTQGTASCQLVHQRSLLSWKLAAASNGSSSSPSPTAAGAAAAAATATAALSAAAAGTAPPGRPSEDGSPSVLIHVRPAVSGEVPMYKVRIGGSKVTPPAAQPGGNAPAAAL